MARREPAAVRSRIQSPSLISQVTSEPASGLACSTEAEIASVSRKSTLRRRSLLHTRHARLAIGMAFHSISGMLTATTKGFALNAISERQRRQVERRLRREQAGDVVLGRRRARLSAPDFATHGLAAGAGCGALSSACGKAAARAAISPVSCFAETAFERARSCLEQRFAGAVVFDDEARAGLVQRAAVTPGCARSQRTAVSASAVLRHSSGTCRRTRPGR